MVMTTTICSLWILKSGTNFHHPPLDAILLGWGRGSFIGFHLAFFTMTALTSQAQDPLWGLCQLSGMPIPIIYSGAGQMIPDGVADQVDPWPGSISCLVPVCLHVSRRTTMTLQICISQFQL